MATCIGLSRAKPHFPEEIDLFAIPHACMRQLLGEYSRHSVNDESEHNVRRVVAQVKKHEAIEDKYIMERLRHRPEFQILKPCSAHAALDAHLATILTLLCSPCNCSLGSVCDCLHYAIDELVVTLLEHMQEEEEVFQPMLVQYFEYEELKTLRQVVISQHQWSDEGLWLKIPTPRLELSMQRLRELENLDSQAEVWEAEQVSWWEEEKANRLKTCTERQDITRDKTAYDYGPFSRLPWELKTHVFSFLNAFDLVQCGQVCAEWHCLAYQPCFWRILPSAGSWKNTTANSSNAALTASNIDGDDWVEWISDEVLPHVGPHIHTIVLTGIVGLSSRQLRVFLASCQQLRHLDVSCTSVSSLAFSGLMAPSCTQLRHLDLSGNSQLTDSALFRLARLWEGIASVAAVSQRPSCTRCCSPALSVSEEGCEPLGLQFLSLSGCHAISKYGLARLAASGMLCSLAYLDLSGCCSLSGKDIAWVVAHCPKLLPEHLAYCDNVLDGPHPSLASCCHNADNDQRFCCRRD